MAELSATAEPEEPSSPSSMEGDRHLLLLAAVSQREQTGLSTPEAEESSMTLDSKDVPCKDDELTAAADASKNTAAARDDGKAVVALPPKKRRRPSEVIAPNADPTTFTLNKNEDFMMQLHRNGLDQIKIPPLYKSPGEESVKRKVSVGTQREVSSCSGGHVNATSRRPPQTTTNKTGELSSTSKIVTGGSSTRQRQIVVPPPSTSLPPPPLGISQDDTTNHTAAGGAAAAMAAASMQMQMRGHDYHQHIMSMSMAGLSVPNRMLLMQQQQQAAASQQQLNNNGSIQPSSLWDDGSSNHPLMLPSKKKQKKEIVINQGGSFKGGDVSWPSTSNGGGLSSTPNPNHSLYNMLQGGGAHQQQLQMMQQRMQPSSSIPLEESSDEGPLKKKAVKTPLKKKRKKKDATTSSATLQGASLTTKDGKPVAFPNQELYSQMLRMKSMMKNHPQSSSAEAELMKNPPQSSEEELAAVFPNQEIYRQMLRMKSLKNPPQSSADELAANMTVAATALPASSQLNPSLSVKKAGPGFMYQDQEESLTIQNRLLQMERALMREQKQKQVQKYLQLQQIYAQGAGDGTNSRIPPAASAARQMSLHDPTLLSQDDPNLQRLSFLELENRVRAEEHDRIIQSSQRQMSELHKQALHLEEQMRLRELDFLQERKRLVDMQTVKRLRLQADELEKRLMM